MNAVMTMPKKEASILSFVNLLQTHHQLDGKAEIKHSYNSDVLQIKIICLHWMCYNEEWVRSAEIVQLLAYNQLV